MIASPALPFSQQAAVSVRTTRGRAAAKLDSNGKFVYMHCVCTSVEVQGVALKVMLVISLCFCWFFLFILVVYMYMHRKDVFFLGSKTTLRPCTGCSWDLPDPSETAVPVRVKDGRASKRVSTGKFV